MLKAASRIHIGQNESTWKVRILCIYLILICLAATVQNATLESSIFIIWDTAFVSLVQSHGFSIKFHVNNILPLPSSAVIMTPTRELALQITKECKKFSKPLGLRVVCVYGGTGISEQVCCLIYTSCSQVMILIWYSDDWEGHTQIECKS